MGLADALNDPNKKQMIVDDCMKLIDELVASQSGLGGMGLKASYAAVNGVKPGYVAGALGRLLPEALPALDPIWNQGLQAGDPVAYLTENSSEAADALLVVTDKRIENAQNGVVKGTYGKLRNSAKKYVQQIIPGLAQSIANHTDASLV
ncbi:DUF6918 family protein [Calothrix sp. NIES-3974]|uniref:DUF6918 family protein n=1 Tax=Calothrix sp. NIES-3974 TaxID=2005462 RepID=UPI000B60ADF7|nr:hypothetical protein [Calothrix sp. NIES-3974]BAZ05198.1 hypothetical protein NIES3974_18440 [Calothrix sp. NIES-3974]